jgi:hypothetical protein
VHEVTARQSAGRGGTGLHSGGAERPHFATAAELFFQGIAMGRNGRVADIQVFECVKLGFFSLADHESLIYRRIAIDHCW